MSPSLYLPILIINERCNINLPAHTPGCKRKPIKPSTTGGIAVAVGFGMKYRKINIPSGG